MRTDSRSHRCRQKSMSCVKLSANGRWLWSRMLLKAHICGWLCEGGDRRRRAVRHLDSERPKMKFWAAFFSHPQSSRGFILILLEYVRHLSPFEPCLDGVPSAAAVSNHGFITLRCGPPARSACWGAHPWVVVHSRDGQSFGFHHQFVCRFRCISGSETRQ